jgi:hypothetical protein
LTPWTNIGAKLNEARMRRHLTGRRISDEESLPIALIEDQGMFAAYDGVGTDRHGGAGGNPNGGAVGNSFAHGSGAQITNNEPWTGTCDGESVHG